jgi:hypothetical protein
MGKLKILNYASIWRICRCEFIRTILRLKSHQPFYILFAHGALVLIHLRTGTSFYYIARNDDRGSHDD